MRLPHQLIIPMDDAAIGPLTGWAPSGSSNDRIKFLCSHGGKILPRPFDAQLKYVGGETRIISVPKDISFQRMPMCHTLFATYFECLMLFHLKVYKSTYMYIIAYTLCCMPFLI